MREFPTVILGDLHGNCAVLLRALQDLGFAGPVGRWAGGARRLVQVGDVIDRGPAPLDALDLLMRLQQEAREAGGEVTCLLGNHELFALRSAAGEHLSRMGWTYNGGGAGYLQWLARTGRTGEERDMPYPEEYYAEFGPEGRYGAWLRTHRIACRVGEYVVVHAGWTPDSPPGVEEANAAFAAAPREAAAFLAALRPDGPLAALQGPLWARRQPDEEIEAACVQLGCKALIAGHTPMAGIKRSVGGRLLQIDTGMSWAGTWSALGLDEVGRPWALLEGAEPVLLAVDGLLPLPGGWPDASAEEKAPQLYHAGDLIRLYCAPDRSWRQYLHVAGIAEFYGYPAYEGSFLTFEEGQWSRKGALWPSERVDKYGRMADPGEVPDDLIPASPA
jgi:hypothetical protein